MNQTLETILNRSSLRKYAKKDIKSEHLDLIIKSAMRAPTAGNMMTYSIIVIKNENKKEVLSETCDKQPFIKSAPVLLVFVADYQKWMDYYKQSDVKNYCKNQNLTFNRPSVASLMLATQDAIIAAQNAVIAAESLGIGSCYIGDIMEQYETHKEILNLPEFAFPVGMLTLGYYPEGYDLPLKGRFNSKYVVFEEEYNQLDVDDIQDMYQHLERRYNPDNRFSADNVAQMHYAFKTGSDFSKEMERSISKALEIWNGKSY